MEEKRYPIPAATHRVEQEIQRSRFITTLAPAPTLEEARAFVARIKDEFPDATHNCWAYLVGPPGSTGGVGMSDDGEPHGTAGRPMLTVLMHSGIGDIAAVVTRYFGGIKLGKGGLVRAYTDSVQQALATLPLSERVPRARLAVTVDYAAIDPLRRMLPAYEAEIEGEEYTTTASYTLSLPAARVEAFRAALLGATSGQALVEEVDAEE